MDPSFLQRLAFVKYLHATGSAQCRAAEPLSSAGLLTLHDAVELFLQLAVEHLNVTEKVHDLKDYWGPLGAKLPAGQALSQQTSMQRLNKARVALKHHGTHPSRLDLSAFRATAQAFFSDNCPPVFGIEFDDISMVDFVQPKEARQLVVEAQSLRKDGKFDEAATALAKSFEEMTGAYRQRSRKGGFRSPYQFGPNMRHTAFDLRGLPPGSRAVKSMTDMAEAVSAMQTALRVMALGIDFRRYSEFKAMVPSLTPLLSGTYHVYDAHAGTRDDETVHACLDFVIESAVALRSRDREA
jgi:hypothetical protein